MDYGLAALASIALIFFFAAFVHGSIGFGFPLIATPLLALTTDLQTAILLTLIPTILVNVVSISSEGNFFVAFRRYSPVALLAMLGGALGTLVLISVDAEIFKLLLAFAILAYLVADRISLNLTWVRTYPQLARIVFGITAGVLGGLTNVMAPVLIIYSLESGHSKSTLIQLSNFCFLLGKIIQLALFSYFGQYTMSELSMSPIMLLVVSMALFIGVQIKKRIMGNTYIKILKGFLLLLALVLVLQFSTQS